MEDIVLARQMVAYIQNNVGKTQDCIDYVEEHIKSIRDGVL